ncbi:MAG: anthranilate phosphoribosyltransferase [Alphaproteobacteria bacterium]|nr:anthranilate phosphoribosyltransferase [Alphaproteobacteria bacterium]
MATDQQTTGDIRPLLAKVSDGQSLTESEAREAFEILMSGDATAAQIGAFLMALRVRGETVAELTGATRTMRDKMLKIEVPKGTIDIVGTGGDAHGTYNISTATALVVAGCGVPVAKHGNRAASSKSGAADVLSAIGVNLEAPPEVVQQSIAEAGIGFLMAPMYHAAMRHVGPSRVEMGVRTIFNMLGPMSNPAMVKRLVVGTFGEEWIEAKAQVLGNLGAEHVWVVHGTDGMDELTTTGPTKVAEYRDGQVRTFEVNPEDAGLTRATLDDLKGGTPEENAEAIGKLLGGETGPFRDIVLLNAAAGLLVAGRVDNLRAGAELAARSIDEGAALSTLERMLTITGKAV